MAVSVEEMLAKRPVDRERVEAYQQQMLAAIRQDERRARTQYETERPE